MGRLPTEALHLPSLHLKDLDTSHSPVVARSRPMALDPAGLSSQLEALKSVDADALRERIAEAKAREQKEEQEAAKRLAAQQKGLREVAEALALGKAAFAAGDFVEAERQFTAALESNLENRHEVICNRAACALKLGRYADAVSDASEATYLEPSYVKGHYRLACALRGLVRLDRALVAVRAGLALQPSNASLLKLVCELETEEQTQLAADPPPSTQQQTGSVATAGSGGRPAAASADRSRVESELAKLAVEREQWQDRQQQQEVGAAVELS